MTRAQRAISSKRPTVDRTLPANGAAKRQRIDLGLDLLYRQRREGRPFSRLEIAAWCGCSDEYIRVIETRALAKLRRRLSHLKSQPS